MPLGALIPATFNGIIVAEKGISVSNIVNGTTRLQPCVMLIGQAAGTLAALCIKQGKNPKQVSVRSVQQQLLNSNAYIMPYYDVKPSSPYFIAIQKIGATGVLKGVGQPYQWANRTWFYPDSLVNTTQLINDVVPFVKFDANNYHNIFLTIDNAIVVVQAIAKANPSTQKNSAWAFANSHLLQKQLQTAWSNWGFTNFDLTANITRQQLAVLLNSTVNLFELKQVSHFGNFK